MSTSQCLKLSWDKIHWGKCVNRGSDSITKSEILTGLLILLQRVCSGPIRSYLKVVFILLWVLHIMKVQIYARHFVMKSLKSVIMFCNHLLLFSLIIIIIPTWPNTLLTGKSVLQGNYIKRFALSNSQMIVWGTSCKCLILNIVNYLNKVRNCAVII